MLDKFILAFLIIIFIIGNLITLSLRIQLIKYIFPFKINNIKLILISISLWIITSSIILAIPFLWDNLFDFSSETLLNSKLLWIYLWIFLSLVILIFHLVIHWKNSFNHKTFFLIFFSFSIIFILLSISIQKLQISEQIRYYIFVALSEEFVKFMFWLSIFYKYKIINNDIIIFSIISALWFSFIENIVYLIYFLQDWNTNYILGILWLLITRWILGFLVHSIFTGNIWLWHLIWFIKWFLLIFGSLGIIIGISLHSGYNILIYHWFWQASIFMIIFGYLWLSWLLYNSDRLYVWYKKEI